jgi:hypothetical protein
LCFCGENFSFGWIDPAAVVAHGGVAVPWKPWICHKCFVWKSFW